jgi:hypothetical protein
VSETTLGPALEFMRQPHDVDVYRGGYWVPGTMVGWRQEGGSSCRVMVRVTEGGAEKTAWADLQDVRLAEHHDSPPTESLPFLPRLPEGRTQHVTSSTPGNRTADDVRPGSGRHRGPAESGHDRVPLAPRAQENWAASPSWPASGRPAPEVEPTRLLPVPNPRCW